jgi:hypothetical protein
MSTCSDAAIVFRKDCVGSLISPILDITGLPTNMTESIERQWILPEYHYNDVFHSMLTFFEISSLEMWPQLMFQAIDTVEIDHIPKRNSRKAIALVFVSFIFLTSFFVMNLFISVIVDKFNQQIKKRQGALYFTPQQREWVKIQRILVSFEPKKIPIEPRNKFRLFFYKIAMSIVFEYLIVFAILVNTITLCLDHYG